MRFVAIEFANGLNGTNMLGYLRIPEDFDPAWSLGFRDYLRDKYKVSGGIKIYNLNINRNAEDRGGILPGYTDMEDDFNLALRSDKYYEPSDETDHIRRQWSMLDPKSPDFVPKADRKI